MSVTATSTPAPLAHEDLGLLLTEGAATADRSLQLLGLLGFLAIAVLALAAWFRWGRRKPVNPGGAWAPSSTEIALAELDEWQGKIAPVDSRAAITAASASLRRFLAANTRLPAPAMTTEELAESALAEQSGVDPVAWSDFAGRSDRIKFAGARPERAELDQLFDLARGLVRSVRPQEDRQ